MIGMCVCVCVCVCLSVCLCSSSSSPLLSLVLVQVPAKLAINLSIHTQHTYDNGVDRTGDRNLNPQTMLHLEYSLRTVCVCERYRERERERERDIERERERDIERERECVCVCVCMYVWERDWVSEWVSEWVRVWMDFYSILLMFWSLWRVFLSVVSCIGGFKLREGHLLQSRSARLRWGCFIPALTFKDTHASSYCGTGYESCSQTSCFPWKLAPRLPANQRPLQTSTNTCDPHKSV